MVVECVGTGALSAPVTSLYPEHINWHETQRPHLTHQQQPPSASRQSACEACWHMKTAGSN
ncbi:hypothetical protein NQZ68_005257 [Dissostichus eleginoides]|nr:hypothetical protein NQZ68_005257 [Dissostichus eleginoides]